MKCSLVPLIYYVRYLQPLLQKAEMASQSNVKRASLTDEQLQWFLGKTDDIALNAEQLCLWDAVFKSFFWSWGLVALSKPRCQGWGETLSIKRLAASTFEGSV